MRRRNPNPFCGCYYVVSGDEERQKYVQPRNYFPQVSLAAHTTILCTASRTVLSQTFLNTTDDIKECWYEFPLYDGVSVVGFTCHIGSRIIKGVAKEKSKAKEVYDEAVSRGETAGLLAQGATSDVFSTTLGNIPAGEKILVEITYVGELKHDMGADGIRFTLPTKISPRYGSLPIGGDRYDSIPAGEPLSISIIVDVSMDKDSVIKELRSSSHPIAVTIGNTSITPTEIPQLSQASATLTLGFSQLDRDFILEIVHREAATPRALLENHPAIPGQRALMMTLVPKFTLRPSRPEIIFVADRSGSMQDKIQTLVSAIKVFLKSLPVGIAFNICSFGSAYSSLWEKSRAYSEDSLAEAIEHVDGFEANYGGTETLAAVRAAIESRSKDQDLSVILCTDGDIWQQQELFSYLNEQVSQSAKSIRVFPLGIGNSVSHALIEGVARAGNGFAQAIGENEKLDGKVVRMLAGAMSPLVTDYALEVKYDGAEEDEDEYVLVEKVTDSLSGMSIINAKTQDAEDSKDLSAQSAGEDGQNRYDHLPAIAAPKLLQTPHNIPPLYPFVRTTVYLLLSPQAFQGTPRAVVVRGTSPQGQVEFEIPVETMPKNGETIHQLAARKAVGELEEGRGWIYYATDEGGAFVKDSFRKEFDQMVEREAVRLGVQYQVGGKWCSFVAVEGMAETVQSSMDTQPEVESPRGFSSPSKRMAQPLTAQAQPLVLNQQRSCLQVAQHGPPAASFRHRSASYFSGGKAPRKQLASMAARKVPLAARSASTTPRNNLDVTCFPDAETAEAEVDRCVEADSGGALFSASMPLKKSKKLHSSAAHLVSQSIPTQDPDPLHQIVYLQSFDGSWTLKPLLNILGLSDNPAATGPGEKEPKAERIWATTLAIQYLEIKMAHEKDAWELLVEKAKGWLDGACAGDAGMRAEWVEMAEKLVLGI